MFDIEEEYKKNADLRQEDVQNIKDWAAKQPHLPSLTDQQIVLFLHSCYYKIEMTEKTITNFFTIRTEAPEIFANRCPYSKPIQEALDTMWLMKLPGKTAEGYDVYFSKLNRTSTEHFSVADIMKAYNMQGDICYFKDCGTSPGVIYAIDMTGFSLGHTFKLNVNILKKHFLYLQEALPVRLKGIHLLNIMSFIDIFINLIKPFVNAELFKMIHYHQSNSEEIYKDIPKNMFPIEYGGDSYHIADLYAETKKSLEECEEWFKNDEFLRIKKSKIQENSNVAREETGLSGTFKKLNFD